MFTITPRMRGQLNKNNNNRTIYFTEEITDLNLLLEMAKSGVTDKNWDDSIETEYVTTDIILMSISDENYTYLNGYDGSYSVKAYSTVYWKVNYNGGLEHILITRATGGWNVLDYQVSISDRNVRIGCTGLNFNDTPSKWEYVHLGTDLNSADVTTSCTITRGTESYTFEFFNLK